MEIKHNNILYLTDISIIGGVETFIFEMLKKYHGLDIAVVYKTAHPTQLQRIRKYCPAYQFKGQEIICKVAIINYDTSIIDYITKDIWKENAKKGEGIFQVIHADYENPAYSIIPQDRRVKNYIAITQHIADSFKKMTGNENILLGYNPLTIEKKKPLILVSATRLSKVKGKSRMVKLAEALNRAEIDYIWYILTTDRHDINLPNVIYIEPRLDAWKWISRADYLVQLSDTEGLSYSINEALYRNIPVIVTPLPYLDEIGVKNGINSYIMEFDCSNIDYIVQNIENIPKFEFKPLKDIYNKILAKGKSKYEETRKSIVKVKCIRPYKDLELNKKINPDNEPYEVTLERAEFLRDVLGTVVVV